MKYIPSLFQGSKNGRSVFTETCCSCKASLTLLISNIVVHLWRRNYVREVNEGWKQLPEPTNCDNTAPNPEIRIINLYEDQLWSCRDGMVIIIKPLSHSSHLNDCTMFIDLLIICSFIYCIYIYSSLFG